jgi:hypothetical protein
MNLLNKQKINSNLGRINTNSIAQQTIGNSDFSVIELDSLLLISSVHDGLCVNCDFKSQCFWKKSKKVFCEHYQ